MGNYLAKIEKKQEKEWKPICTLYPWFSAKKYLNGFTAITFFYACLYNSKCFMVQYLLIYAITCNDYKIS